MTIKPRKTFSTEFKIEAVHLLEKGDKAAAQLAKELGVRRNQLYKWQKEVHQYGREAFPGHGKRAASKQSDKTLILKAELTRLREENEILKRRRFTSRGSPHEVCVYRGAKRILYGVPIVFGDAGIPARLLRLVEPASVGTGAFQPAIAD